MFALNPRPRLKPRFVFDSASIGLGRALPVKRWNFPLCQEDWGYRHLKPTFNRAQISAQWCRRISQRIFTPETRDSRPYEFYALEPGPERVRHRVLTVIVECRRPVFDRIAPAGSPDRLAAWTALDRRQCRPRAGGRNGRDGRAGS